MSISSDILDAPEGLDGLEDGLTEDLIGDQDEDNLLDAALGDVSTLDKDNSESDPLLAITPTEDVGDSILDEANDSVQVEEDPVRFLISAHPCF